MTKQEIAVLTQDNILSEEVFEDIFLDADPLEEGAKRTALRQRAKQLGMLKDVDETIKDFKRQERERKAEELRAEKSRPEIAGITNFDWELPQMRCGSWKADDSGVYALSSGSADACACRHPIAPIGRTVNLETREQQVILAYRRDGITTTITVPRETVSTASKIVGLSRYGVGVTSENARLLVRFLSDVDAFNGDLIETKLSTSKLGWKDGDNFVPYDDHVRFDGDTRFAALFSSIESRGNPDRWYEHVREIRATGRVEIRALLAASFASILLKLTGSLPFFVDLWGETEGGKTVAEMVAASVWANPDESQFIGDFKTTDTALEAKADMLNHLPMILDDTSKANQRIRDNFEAVIYDLCSGKGKSRSNRELGMNRENHWRNIIICNGERPLSGYVDQGGALNRVIEIECGSKLFEDPRRTADIVKANYGHAGRDFVEAVKYLGEDQIRSMHAEALEQIQGDDTMQKQAIALAHLLVADQIATESLFKDDKALTATEIAPLLASHSALSDGARCYEYLLDKVQMNRTRFGSEGTPPTSNSESWGVIDRNRVYFFPRALTELCDAGNFNKKAFISWAIANRKVALNEAGSISYRCEKRLIETRPRMNVLIFDDGTTDANGFLDMDTDEELPFS